MIYPKAYWNERFAVAEYVYGTEPNDWFRDQIAHLPKGKILLPAEGEGRNAVFAAKEGWAVFAFDLSEAGQQKALQLAEKSGVRIQYDIADIQEYALDEKGPWDVIGLFYAHFPPDYRAETHRRIAQALRPGGYLILEAFNPEQLGRSSGGPKNLDMLYTLDMMLHDFSDLTVVRAELASVQLHEGAGHEGMAEVVRLLLQKP